MNTATDGKSARGTDWGRRLLFGRNPLFTLVRCLALAVVCFLVFKFVLLPIRVRGESMLPTYQDHGVRFVNRLAYLRNPPRRGDVVAIRLSGESIMFMKRIVGLPGETLTFHQGHILINGELLPEPYVKLPCNWELAPEQIGPDEYFVVGDNRSMESADHEKGRAERRRIVGKVL